MLHNANELAILAEALQRLDASFADLPAFHSEVDPGRLRATLLATADRLRETFPFPHPLYVGQMLKPPHPVARLAYTLALGLNPNNHALDGGPASSHMEKEAVADLARMFGWNAHLGHLSSGGTFANFEALWIARELRPGRKVVASARAHYTHERLSSVLQMPFDRVPVDALGRMDVAALDAMLAQGDIGTVVVTLGTTAAGTVDPLGDILELRRRHDFRVHVDAAYGGYFTLATNLSPATRAAFDALAEVDSLVVDPHKHGLQPYGCGCVLFRDPSVGRFYRHDSPYTYFSSDELHLGEISLECSRPGASAVALWATHQLLPPIPGCEFARSLTASREAALTLWRWLDEDPRFSPIYEPELDIVVWSVRGTSARAVFESAAREGLHLAMTTLPGVGTCLRACTMKPEHREWMPEILRRLDAAARAPA